MGATGTYVRMASSVMKLKTKKYFHIHYSYVGYENIYIHKNIL